MSQNEQTEKVRQAIMRLRELMDIMRANLDDGEARYKRLFAGCTPEEIETLPHKQLQWRAAERMGDDTAQLERAIVGMQFDSRELMRAFEELHGVLLTSLPDEE